MDVNALMQMLGLTPASMGQAAGIAPAGNLARAPQQDYSRIQKLMQFLRQAQSMPQFQAAKGAIGETTRDVQGMMGQAGQEVSPLVKAVYQRGMPLAGQSAFNALNLAPLPTDLINNLMQMVQGPQG